MTELTNDVHSYHAPKQPRVQHVTWCAQVDFDRRVLHCRAVMRFNRTGMVDLDTRDLTIESVVANKARKPVRYELGESHAILGQRLRLYLPRRVRTVTIEYTTSPNATGLQWLEAEQTLGKSMPFVYSQGQAIHARSFLPCQDTPGIRITFDAHITVPIGFEVVVAANELVGSHEDAGQLTRHYRLNKSVPSYLLAFAVGNLVSRELSDRSRVWAEPQLVDQASLEFNEIDQIMQAAEGLYGPYPWGRFDILILPPSFPFGGMENPTCTFMTPAIITGDRSMIDVVAHELAHGWTGNLVTNANWSDFWLNEGWTTWAEFRIIEAVRGKEQAILGINLLERNLVRDILFLRRNNMADLTRLKTPMMRDVDPDDAYTTVPYAKGAMLLRTIEKIVGRSTFDAFARAYINSFAFRSVTLEQFLNFLKLRLPGIEQRINIDEWIYGTGIPTDAPRPNSLFIDQIKEISANFDFPTTTDLEDMGPNGLCLYLECLPRSDGDLATIQERAIRLGTTFDLAYHPNLDVRSSFLIFVSEIGIAESCKDAIEQLLRVTGRLKYVKPLYDLLAHNPKTIAWAWAIYETNRNFYHITVRGVVEGLFKSARESEASAD